MLIDKGGDVVDLAVDDHPEIITRSVLLDLGELVDLFGRGGSLSTGHFDVCVCG